MDTDMAGIVHFTAYFRYMETAEHELFRTLGLAAATQDDDRLGRTAQLGGPFGCVAHESTMMFRRALESRAICR